MTKKMVNLIFSGVLSVICLILLIYVVYAWFVEGGSASATKFSKYFWIYFSNAASGTYN